MTWLSRLGSLKVSVVLLALLFLTVLGGTLAQAAWGSEAVLVGGGLPGVPALLGLLGGNLALGAWFHLERTFAALGLWIVHGALIAFCGAGLGSSLFQEELVVGIVPGATTGQAYLRSNAGVARDLPFRLTLESFRVETYPASAEPSDYVSEVRLADDHRETSLQIRMNQPARLEGWTIYQSSMQAVDGKVAPVFKLVYNPLAWFPSVATLALAVGAILHVVGRGGRRG